MWYYKNGRKRIEGKYVNGQRTGEWLRYTLQGDEVEIPVWGDEQVILIETGVKEEYEYYLDEEKQRIKHGFYMKYYFSGEPRIFGAYKNGKKEGQWEGYWKNGNRAFEGTYDPGLRVGTWVQCYPNGNVRSKKNF